MKIDFDATITDINGTPVEEEPAVIKDGVEVKPSKLLTLKSVAVNSLMQIYPDEHNLSGEEKANRFVLAMRINQGGEQDAKPEDISKIKQLVGKLYGPMVVGRAYEMLNG